ncbi:hypothetical protein Agabi119p4_5063 [Agaricus bisporus var. burnettii]|uniref:Uncharacterized protein n=2 Tax=Agaricus bisporus TaxID=5341 RepID=A0A8H7KHW8_AGABI|nr:hypothetical protein Agabi119p4_5063 [Agaricus bisporus var. burnettii]
MIHSLQLKPPQQLSERATLAHDDFWDAQHLYNIVEHLDVIDPQVGTISTLANTANAIVIPLNPFLDRRPVITLPTGQRDGNEAGSILRWEAIYGFLVVFWGASIVVFLARIINFHNDDLQGFWVEVSSQVENGLLTATGIGLVPFRVIGTYRVYKIWYYKRKTIRLRRLAGLPHLFDPDDHPDPYYDNDYVHVLSDKEQQDLHRQQVKFQYHQTWYRAHGSETHRAFPINVALGICCLNDGNSIFQAVLCGDWTDSSARRGLLGF